MLRRQSDRDNTRGRPPDWYAARLQPLRLDATAPRLIEPGYPRADVGTYLFFHRP